jgi:DNA-binding Lrp family transcriptional regulator
MRADIFRPLDRQIAQALHIDARAPFSRIGEVLGVSDKTVARRYARLRELGALKVVGLTDPLLDTPWFLRVRCVPGAEQQVAEALARRQDTAWVYLTSGGTEIFSGLRATDDDLLSRLPRTPRVSSVEAHRILHLFYGGPRSLLDKTSILSEDQVRRLRPSLPAPVDVTMTDADHQIVAVVNKDARAPVAELTAATGLSAATVRRRLAELRASGTLYFDVDYDDSLLDVGLRAIIWLTVAPAHLEEVGHAMAGHAQTAFVAATTGPAALCVSVSCADSTALYDYLTRQVAPLTGIHHLETAPVLRAVKYASREIHAPR